MSWWAGDTHGEVPHGDTVPPLPAALDALEGLPPAFAVAENDVPRDAAVTPAIELIEAVPISGKANS